MKKFLVLLTVLTALGTAYAHSEAAPDEKITNPVKATAESIAQGKKIYEERCASCHGIHGKGASQSIPDLTNHEMMSEMSEGDMFHKISEGVPGTSMPPWKDALTEEERWHLVNYINTLHHGEETLPEAEAETQPREPVAPAPEKGICGPTALLVPVTLPLGLRALRRRRTLPLDSTRRIKLPGKAVRRGFLEVG